MSVQATQKNAISPNLVRKIRSFFGRNLLSLIHTAQLIKTYAYYLFTGKNHPLAFHFIVLNFCRTEGVSNELLHSFIRIFNPKKKLPQANGCLGFLSKDKVKKIAAEIEKRGFYVHSDLLPKDLTNRIADSFYSGKVRPLQCKKKELELFHFSEKDRFPLSATYSYDETFFIQHADVQNLLSDSSLLAVAQEYLGCCPIIDAAQMWWSQPMNGEPKSEAAQLYHFDLDHAKFLKLFLYLTDVTPETGPHCMIEKTHHPFQKPKAILKGGYQRNTDEEMEKYFKPEQFQEFCGPKGTLIFVDTRSFHKGKPPIKGGRLIVELQYTSSLFGIYQEGSKLIPHTGSQLEGMVKRFPMIYKKWLSVR